MHISDRAEKPLELLHADICGPISPSKNDAFQAFKKFKVLTENKTGYKIRTLRTDRGGEFLSTEFTRFCGNEGIERHLTAPYTPQQNGVVERRNRTVIAMARSLLKGTHMPARFWGEAIRHAVYLLNRLPTKALGERTPFEAWMGRKPHLSHLRVFGCVAYVKNTTPHLKKLDDRSSPMVYLGVEEGCKAHRLFDPKRGKLQVSRDAIFQENCEWTWNAGANNEENLPEFSMLDASYSDEPIVAADTEAGVEDVTPPSEAVVPMTSVSSPSTPSSNAYAATSSSESNTPESYEGPVRYRSLADIYANTEEIVGINEEVMMVMSEEPTCYQEAATEACCLEELGFKKCTQEHAVYTRRKGEVSILVGVYVDDLIVTGSSTENINKFKQQMMAEFDMSDLGLLSYYLGIEVEQQKNRILLRQSAYAKKILSHFKMADCNATKHPMEPKTQLHKDLEGTPIDATEYRRLIGCLRYLLHTRPDLSYSVGMASRYMERPTIMHHKVVKQILRYLKGTIHFGLVYIKGPQEFCIFGYSDSDLAGDLDGRKSTSGMAFYLNESLVSWNSQKQKTVALSSCEAEFMAATTAACHALWLKSLASELTGVEPKPVTLFVDNKSAIALMKNPVFHGRSKHIDTKFHFIRECVEKGQIEVEFVNTGEQRADVLTKALSGVKLAAMRQLLGSHNAGSDLFLAASSSVAMICSHRLFTNGGDRRRRGTSWPVEIPGMVDELGLVGGTDSRGVVGWALSGCGATGDGGVTLGLADLREELASADCFKSRLLLRGWNSNWNCSSDSPEDTTFGDMDGRGGASLAEVLGSVAGESSGADRRARLHFICLLHEARSMMSATKQKTQAKVEEQAFLQQEVPIKMEVDQYLGRSLIGGWCGLIPELGSFCELGIFY
ncbi:hypothetical protein ZIOFF_017373 [Zingiber officinale]|uniref:Integrase catalytic domain-containing protein n=1 Tax=Zingiber officinale TaxID=94328 RepID=A0A8J5H6Z3_ZINOF|nr:hypothetical protein ZIOFF_017373 [Zingiber officinale]